MSRLHAKRLVTEGYRDTPMVLPGLYAGPVAPSPGERVDAALVVYAGRHVREKRIDALVRAFARAAAQRSDLRLELYGDGPSRTAVERLAHALGVGERVRIAGRVPEEEVAAAFSRAACVATASEREGYGLIVVEAAAYGTPSVVVAGPENAATELVQDGVNGAVARDATPGELADALLRVIDAGSALRKSTAGWFAENARNLMLDRSVALVLDAYRQSSLEYRSPAIRSR
jgi:glycosyltransferase involved in cell wall biosynthesis